MRARVEILRLSPIKKKRSPRQRATRLAVLILVLFLIITGGIFYLGYYFNTNIQQPIAGLIHPVSRGSDEPPSNNVPAYNTIMGRSWNILLLGSDNDGKYKFPDVLTQVMMIVHVDTA